MIAAQTNAKNAISDRQWQLIQLIGLDGLNTKETADKLKLSDKTVEHHFGLLKKKIGVRSHADLVRFALEHGMKKSEPTPARLEVMLPGDDVSLVMEDVTGIAGMKKAVEAAAKLAAKGQANPVQINSLCVCVNTYINLERHEREGKLLKKQAD